MLGNGIAMDYSKLPWSLDWEFAPHSSADPVGRTMPVLRFGWCTHYCIICETYNSFSSHSEAVDELYSVVEEIAPTWIHRAISDF